MERCGALIESNAYPPCLRGKRCILVYSACIEQLYPGLLDKLGLDCAAFSVCPEHLHVNQVGFKLAGMLARAREVEEVIVFTVDGSMHCVQLHYMLEELEKIMPGRFRRRHLVYEKGAVQEVQPKTVKVSRFLTRVEKLLSRSDTTNP